MKFCNFRNTFFLFLTTPLIHAESIVFESFEGDGFGTWQVEGKAFGDAAVPGKMDGVNGDAHGFSDEKLVMSGNGRDPATGTLTSPEFLIEKNFICFRIAGGNHKGRTCVQLIVDGKVVQEAVGNRTLDLTTVSWNVELLKGLKGKIKVVDLADKDGDWSMIAADHFVFSDVPSPGFPPEKSDGPWSSMENLVDNEIIKGIKIPKDVKISLDADYKNQNVVSPTAISFDEQGKLYVAETYRFRKGVEDDRNCLYWYLDDLAAQTTDDRLAMYKKWEAKIPMATWTERSEKILLLEDKDKVGKLNHASVFADGFNQPLDGTAAGVYALNGTVFFACIPNIWALQDKNHDGKVDERKVIQDGFGVRVSFSGHDLNGFAMGPDGMIYATLGDRGYNFTTKAGKKYAGPGKGCIVRFDTDGSNLELIHDGLRNPKEIAFDKFGNGITVDNNSDQKDKARIVQIAYGADSGWEMEHQALHPFYKQIGLEKAPPNRWMAEKMWELKNNDQPAFILPPIAHIANGPSGLTYYPGTGFLASEENRFLICDYRGMPAASGISSFLLEKDGATLKLKDARRFNWSVAATDVEYSYDGKVTVADYMGGWSTHDDGRIYTLDAGDKMNRPEAAKQTAELVAQGIEKLPVETLAKLLKHPDMRVRLRAQVALTQRKEGIGVFEGGIESTDSEERRHSVWGLGIIARRGIIEKSENGFASIPDKKIMRRAAEKLVTLFKHSDEETRMQATKALCDYAAPGIVEAPIAYVLHDDSPAVRFHAAILVGKWKQSQYLGDLITVIEENEDKDAYLRHAYSFALSQLSDNAAFSALRAETNPSVRLATVIALRRAKNILIVDYIQDENSRVSDEAVRAIHDTMFEEARPYLMTLLDERAGAKHSEMIWRRLITSAFRLGKEENAKRLLDIAADGNMPESIRIEALRLLSVWEKPPVADQSIGHYAPLPARDFNEIKKVMVEKLPNVIRSGDSVLASALGLVSQYKLSLPSLSKEELVRIVDHTAYPDQARAEAVKLFAKNSSADQKEKLAAWTQDKKPLVAITALASLNSIDQSSALAPLRAATESNNTALAQGAWNIIGDVTGKDAADLIVAALEKLTAAKGKTTTALEVLAAAEKRKEPTVIVALKAYQDSIPKNDLLAQWATTLEGGDKNRGAEIFNTSTAECIRCHKAGSGHDGGGDSAPNLAGLATRNHGNRDYFLQSLIEPSAVIASGFGTVTVTTKDGAENVGILTNENAESVTLETTEQLTIFLRKDIQEISKPASSMPPMTTFLKPNEIRDVIAWLASLDKEEEVKKSNKETVTYQLSTAAPAEKPVAAASTDIDAAQMKRGKDQYALCQACHGTDGNGVTGVAPPLAGSEWVNGVPENLIRIQLRGLQGSIKVKGTDYNLAAPMPPQAFQTDEQIADVLTYVRNSFGNKASAVTVDEVKKLRDQVGKPMLTADQLIAPAAKAPEAEKKTSTAPSPELPKVKTARKVFGLPLWGFSGLIAFLALCIFMFKREQ